MKPENLSLLKSVGQPTVHPDGTRCVVSVTRPDFDADAYVGQLWSVPTAPGALPRRITRGFRDTAPSFSPDGQVLAFLRASVDGPHQLYLVQAAGGEPQAVTDRLLGVTGFAWAPDSHRMVFSSPEPDDGRYGTVDDVPPGREDARLITDLNYRGNGAGYTHDKSAQLFLLEVPDLGAEPRPPRRGRARVLHSSGAGTQANGSESSHVPAAVQLTSQPVDHTDASFTSDGKAVLFVAALHAGRDTDLVRDIYSLSLDPLPLNGGNEPLLIRPTNHQPSTVGSVRESSNGKWLFFTSHKLGTTGIDFVARNTALYTMPAGGGEATVVTDVEVMDVSASGAQLERHGPDGVLVLNSAQGTVELLQVQASGGSRLLVQGNRVVTGASSGGGALIVVATDPLTAGDVWVVEDDGGFRQLTDFSADLRTATDVIEPLELTVTGQDGYEVHGWVVKPAGSGPHPVLLTIHGGPFSQYSVGFFDEAQVYAAAGYAVLMCNPRGSAGYGQEHGRAIKEKLGTLDNDDVLGFLDGALEQVPGLDADRLGIQGGSYGGYLTAWVIAHDHRFKGAIVERGFLDPVSFTGSADIGWFFGPEYVGSNPSQVAAQSPMAAVEHVETPTLVIHSENDLRCPIEQGQRYFTALKMQGTPTSLLVFPGEDHELSRTGTPVHRRQRFMEILRWWNTWLPVGDSEAPISS